MTGRKNWKKNLLTQNLLGGVYIRLVAINDILTKEKPWGFWHKI